MHNPFPSQHSGPRQHSPYRHNASRNRHSHPIRYKPDKKSNWKCQQPKQHGPAPLCSCQLYGPECLAALEDDEDLACDNDGLDKEEAVVVRDSIKEVQAVVNSSGTIIQIAISSRRFL